MTFEAEQWIVRNKDESLDCGKSRQMQSRISLLKNRDCESNAAE